MRKLQAWSRWSSPRTLKRSTWNHQERVCKVKVLHREISDHLLIPLPPKSNGFRLAGIFLDYAPQRSWQYQSPCRESVDQDIAVFMRLPSFAFSKNSGQKYAFTAVWTTLETCLCVNTSRAVRGSVSTSIVRTGCGVRDRYACKCSAP